MPMGPLKRLFRPSLKNPCAANDRVISQIQRCNDTARKSVDSLGRKIANLDRCIAPLVNGTAAAAVPRKKK